MSQILFSDRIYNILVFGCSNTGKSCLINTLLTNEKDNLVQVRKNARFRAFESDIPCTISYERYRVAEKISLFDSWSLKSENYKNHEFEMMLLGKMSIGSSKDEISITEPENTRIIDCVIFVIDASSNDFETSILSILPFISISQEKERHVIFVISKIDKVIYDIRKERDKEYACDLCYENEIFKKIRGLIIEKTKNTSIFPMINYTIDERRSRLIKILKEPLLSKIQSNILPLQSSNINNRTNEEHLKRNQEMMNIFSNFQASMEQRIDSRFKKIELQLQMESLQFKIGIENRFREMITSSSTNIKNDSNSFSKKENQNINDHYFNSINQKMEEMKHTSQMITQHFLSSLNSLSSLRRRTLQQQHQHQHQHQHDNCRHGYYEVDEEDQQKPILSSKEEEEEGEKDDDDDDQKMRIKESIILSKQQFLDLKKIFGFEYEEEGWKLLFRASEFNFSARSFHQKCDGYNGTLVVIKTDKDIVFGGYNSSKWNKVGDNKWFPANGSCVFGFEENQVVKIDFDGTVQWGIFCHSNFGPFFGAGAIGIYDKCDLNDNSYTELDDFEGYVHQGKGKHFLNAGKKFFKVKEYEVFTKIKK